ncbi:MAG: hypothetical protein R3A52_16040 [Polyangiales bacterium]
MSSFRSALAVLLVSVLAACAIENPSTINRPDGGPCGEAGQQCCFAPNAGVDAGRSLCTGSNTTCIAGSCVACGGPTSTLCGTGDSRVCVDLNTNANCGACGNACAAGTQCESVTAAGDAGVSGGMDAGRSDAGAMVEDAGPNAPMFVCRTVCVGGLSRCGEVCRDLTTDQQNCGRCGNACSFPNGVAACQSSACRLAACVANFGNCDMMDGNGCETDFRSTVTHCGACGNACNLPNASPVCTNGACRVGTCNPGFADCDGNPANGCEVDTRVSTANCGTCGNMCPTPSTGGTPICTMGMCGVDTTVCPMGRASCDGNSSNGCEVNTTNDVANCGMCGTTCTAMNATPACVASTCVIPSGGCTGTFRDCDGMYVNGCEVNTNTSVTNCGACNAACIVANGTPACTSGRCAIAACNAGFANCDGTSTAAVQNGCETNTNTDNNNCGGCGTVCGAGRACVAGTCTITCTPGAPDICNNVCVNRQTDNNNCGACGTVCTGGQSCNAGACACPSGQFFCGGTCVNRQTDNNNCGTCGNVCPGGQRCASGACVTSCPSTQTDCSGTCRDTRNDPLACGGCGTVCSFSNGVATCTSSTCTLAACNSGRGNCDGNNGNGCETNTATSASNCGVCGNGCQFANAAASCSSGRCVMGACDAGFADCNNNSVDGCETNIANGDIGNCGACGTACPAPPVGASALCVNRMCSLSTLTCPSDRRDCTSAAGCETMILTDPLNCGACGNVCSQTGGTRSCVGGTCRIACNTGLGDCDGAVTNGCETNLNTSAANCGGCGRACSLANATAGCASGACTVASCNAGFANCNGMANDGCEINTQNDNNNCGACGNVCPGGQRCSAGTCVSTCPSGQVACGSSCVTTATDPDHCGGCSMVCSNNNIAARTCTASACSGACSTGFADCNSNLRSDGCEVNLNTNATNCGGCGMACSTNHVTAACSGGVCNGACAAGFADCNTNKRTDGCETETTSNVSNCGGCGNVCPTRANATATCASSACGFTCSAGFGNCNTMDGDGCEAPLDTVTNCGACGVTCPMRANATATCTGTPLACGFTCAAGFADCNAMPGDGCETTLASTGAHCGACGAACPSGSMNADGGCAMSRCTCTPNHGDCNGSRADGCEANLQNDDANCGACGNACPVGQACMSGT